MPQHAQDCTCKQSINLCFLSLQYSAILIALFPIKLPGVLKQEY